MEGLLIANAESKKFIKKYDYNSSNDDIKFTSIILVTYNQLNYTQICIESIRKFTKEGTYEIIVVDNASSDDTLKWLNKQQDIKVIANEKNKGFPVACNQAINVAIGENILLLNNDTIVTPKWLKNLNDALYSEKDIAVVGAISNSCSNNQQIMVNYYNIAEMINFAETLNNNNENIIEYRPRLIGFCYMIKKDVLEQVGLLDERFSPGNFEDDDLSFRILEKGYKLALCKNVFIHHFGGVSFGRSEKYIEISNINEKKFFEKWGFNVRYSALTRTDILALMNMDDANKSLNVLEVGCGVGATLLEVKNRFKNANLYGIEISEGAGKVASGVCNAIVGNIENLDLPYKSEFFDYIILGDVLEHLINPWEVLIKIKKYLKKSGYILASIPNIMHIGVMRNLLNGRFKYEEAGILDKTHLRFFTLAEIDELFKNTGYIINSINGVAFPATKEDEEFIDGLCKLGNVNLKQQFNIYQYILKISKAEVVIEDKKNDQLELVEKIKVKLLRIEYDLEVEESLDYLINQYEKYNENLAVYIKSLIEVEITNKEKVLNKIIKKAEEKGLDILVKELKG